ncbi:MAG: nickel pincer cofactor biosynthesis protein LarB [Deltaproteobacteria bacterium]|nr:nickel pincer cofactor biosynthesis protein LarB [Deltaproteobacteria bacterium]
MNPSRLRHLLQAVKTGGLSVTEAECQLRDLPFEDIGVALVDHHRELRQGFPEVLFGEGKSAEQLISIMTAMAAKGGDILVTRVAGEKAAVLTQAFASGDYDPLGRTFVVRQQAPEPRWKGTVLVVCAGTSDLPVAREASVTARVFGNRVEELTDVGVAGLHRLFSRSGMLSQAAVIIVVAGMEGALPSVIGGLVPVPVIAVPTSVGYGAAFNGLAALLGMLNSCASGVTVVNIDNGFGAACAATRINRTGGETQ